MIRTRFAVAILFIGLFVNIVSCGAVYAVEALSTPDDYWLKDTELKISAYKRTADGTDLSYIEIFNDSDHLLDVSNWKMTGVFGAASSRYELPILSSQSGQLKPKGHAVVQIAAEVTGASFDGGAWKDRPADDTAVLNSVEITGKDSGWKTDAYILKSSTKTVVIAGKSTSVPVYDDFWVRTQISGESYSSTLSSFTAATEQLYDDGLYVAPAFFPGQVIEVYSYASDCAPNDTSILCGDYIKLHVDKNADISNFLLRTDSNSSSRTTSNTFSLAGRESNITADGYLVISLDDNGDKISLTNSGGYIWGESLYDQTPYVATMAAYPSAASSQQGFAYALMDDGSWQWTTTPQPGLPNKLTVPIVEVTTCPEGKYLSPDTGRCRTIEEAVNALAACPEGQERNPATNRCRSKVLAASITLVACGEGQERNPATNRCRSIASAVAELLPCDEGYERNPATNRCRKIVALADAAVGTPAQLIEQAKGSNWDAWTWALVAVGATGAVGYGVYEWRHELLGFGQKIAGRFGRK